MHLRPVDALALRVRSPLRVFVQPEWQAAMATDFARYRAAGDDEFLARIKSDFRNFLFLTWAHLGLPEPTPVQYDIALWLQHGPKRSITEAFRGVGKSWITSAFVCWLLLRNPDDKVLVVSASKVRADDFSTFTRRLIHELPILQHLKPLEGQRDANVAFDVGPARAAHAPSVKSLGITSQLTGSRADWIIPDDIEVPNNSSTQLMRDKLAEQVKEFDAILSPKAGSAIRFLGTPQCEMSVYNVLSERGYTIRVWPAEVLTKIDTYKGRLAPSVLDTLARGVAGGTPIEPTRFSSQDLLERKASYGRSGYALQFMLDTTVSDANRYPLKLADFIVFPLASRLVPVQFAWGSGPEQVATDLQPVGLAGDRWHRPLFYSEKEFADVTDVCLAIDPSGRGVNETAYAVVGWRDGWLFLFDAGGFREGYTEATLKALALVALRWKVNSVYVESNFGDGMFTKLFEPVLHAVHRVVIEEDRSSVQKEKRVVDTLEPLLNQHRLVVSHELVLRDARSAEDPRYQLFYQLTRITRDKGALAFDDRIDVLAMGVARFASRLGLDASKAAERHRDRMLEEEVRKWQEAHGQAAGARRPTAIDNIVGVPGDTWIPELRL